MPLYTETAFSVYNGTQYSHIRAHVKVGAWMGAGFYLECGLLFYFSITIWACALICEFSVPYMWMLGALICEYWGVGVLIRGNWVSLYSSYGHALIFGTYLIYEKLENYPFSAYKGMSLYAGQYGTCVKVGLRQNVHKKWNIDFPRISGFQIDYISWATNNFNPIFDKLDHCRWK